MDFWNWKINRKVSILDILFTFIFVVSVPEIAPDHTVNA